MNLKDYEVKQQRIKQNYLKFITNAACVTCSSPEGDNHKPTCKELAGN